jgi:predicted amidohydrolase YtcJ
MNHDASADLILRSRSVFTGAGTGPSRGFVAIAGERILAAGSDGESAYAGPRTRIVDLGDRTVCPGFTDVHCFFGGYAMGLVGADLGGARSADEAIDLARREAASRPEGACVLGHGLSPALAADARLSALDEALPTRAVVLFAAGGETCWMSAAARSRYGFSPERCYPEAYWRLLGEVLGDRESITPAFRRYMAMLNGRGVTAVKEMGFDDYYGFADTLAGLEAEGGLSLHVAFMSQPVGRGMDQGHGRAMRSRFGGPAGDLAFSGFNRMTDGSISQLQGDLKLPYSCAPGLRCGIPIDYPLIEREVLEADAAGFRFSLHAQGDAAVAKAVDIFAKCAKDGKGRLRNRHAITDVEFSDPEDLERMGELGVVAEVYPQIMSLASRASKIAMIDEKIGPERGKRYWNRRKMIDGGVIVSCGTDLPLLVPDIPESIYHACGALFPEGGEPFNPGNALSVPELLTAWTRNGAYNLGQEGERGSLETGKLADIAVFDRDLFALGMGEIRKAKVASTYWRGKLVYGA